MPVHNWTRVSAGTFHDFHTAWIAELRKVLNSGLLPEGYYAQAEQAAGEISPDVLTLKVYALKRRRLVIRHASGDEMIAIIEVLSPGNKASKAPFARLLNKLASALLEGIHLLLIDVFPPGSLDPEGIHGALWAEFSSQLYDHPPDKPLTWRHTPAASLRRLTSSPSPSTRAFPTCRCSWKKICT